MSRRALFGGLALATAASAACSLFLSTDDLTDTAVSPEASTPDATAADTSTPETPATHDGSTPPDGAALLTYRDEVLADGPVLYLRLEETFGAEAKDEVPGNPASFLVGPFKAGIPGAMDGSVGVKFDGGGAGILAGEGFMFDGRKPFTLEGWFKPEAFDATFRFLVSRDARDDAGRQGYGLWAQTEYGLQLERHVDGTKRGVSTPVPTVGAWHHVVGMYDGSVLRLYLDGVLVSTQTDDRVMPAHAASLWFARVSESGPALYGAIDEVAVYDKALPTARVLAHYAASKK